MKTRFETTSFFSRTASLLGITALTSATSQAATQIFSFGGDYVSGGDVNLEGHPPFFPLRSPQQRPQRHPKKSKSPSYNS